jgi:hypothetical protein
LLSPIVRRKNKASASASPLVETKLTTSETLPPKVLTSRQQNNGVIYTPSAKFMSLDIQAFSLNKPLARHEYMRVALKDIPTAIIKYYGLEAIAVNGSVYCDINKGMYGLPQSGILANNDPVIHLKKYGYFQSVHTPGLFTL